MRVSLFHPNRFVASHISSEDRELLKRLNFSFCKFERHWYTIDLKRAARLRDHFDASLKRKIDRCSLTESPWTGRVLTTLGNTLHPVQLRGVKFAMTRNHSYLAYEMGLGKTPTGITIMNLIHDDALQTYGNGGLQLLVVPPALISNWVSEIALWQYRPFKIQIVNTRGTFEVKPGIDLLIVADSLFPDVGVQTTLMSHDFDQILVDEAQRYLVSDSKRTKFIFGEHVGGGLVHRAPRVVMLSGTPMSGGHMDLYPTLKALAWNDIQYRSEHQYGLDFCAGFKEEVYKGKYVWNYRGSSNAGLLGDWIKGSFYLHEKLTDNVKELRGKLEERVVSIKHNMPVEVKRLEKVLLAGDRNLKLRQIIGGNAEISKLSAYRKALSKAKLKPGVAYVRNILNTTDASVLVFAVHVSLVERLKLELKTFKPLVIYGKTKKPERDIIERRFQNGRSRLLIANISTMVGLNLTKGTRGVFIESSWSATDNDQARARLFRIGQKRKVIVDHLVLADSLDEYVLNAIVKKKTAINKLF